MKDEIGQIKLFLQFLAITMDNTSDRGELQAVEDAALEIFYKARMKKRTLIEAQAL